MMEVRLSLPSITSTDQCSYRRVNEGPKYSFQERGFKVFLRLQKELQGYNILCKQVSLLCIDLLCKN